MYGIMILPGVITFFPGYVFLDPDSYKDSRIRIQDMYLVYMLRKDAMRQKIERII